jgi:serine/threonine protein kinase
LFADEDCAWDFDDHMFEFMHMTRRPRSELDEACVDQDTANRTAKSAAYRVEKLRKEWLAVEQNTEDPDSIRRKSIAPFEWKEIRTGGLLGNGGFSTVREVLGFETNLNTDENQNLAQSDDETQTGETVKTEESVPAKPFTVWEHTSREFLRRHAVLAKVEHSSDSLEERKKKTPMPDSMPRYAVKHLKASIMKDPERFRKSAVDLALEAALLMKLDHPNIIKLRASCRAGPDSFRAGKHTSFFFVMDLLPETLDERIWDWRRSLKKYKSRCNFVWGTAKYQEKIRKLLLSRLRAAGDIASALEYMHTKRIINRDVKTSNVGFDVHGEVKIYDLGLSRLLPADADKDDAYKMSCVGTKNYMAPEIRNKEPYNMSVDMYSFGIVLWEIMSLSTPVESFYKQKQKNGSGHSQRNCVRLPLCECWPTAIQNLIRRSTAYEPLRRPFMSQARDTLQQQLHDLGMEAGGIGRRRSTFEMQFVQAELEKQVRSSLESLTTLVDYGDQSSHRSIEENDRGERPRQFWHLSPEPKPIRDNDARLIDH